MKSPAIHLIKPPFLPSGLGRFISLRTKFVVFFSLIIILTCSGMSWYFIYTKRLAMTERVRDLGAVLVKNLAHNVRYGIIIEERVILEQFIDGVMGVDEVVYAMITGGDGQVLAAKSKGKLINPLVTVRSTEQPFYPRPDIAELVVKSPPTEPIITRLRLSGSGTIPITEQDSALSFSTAGIREETFYDFAIPVLKRTESRLDALALQDEETRKGGVSQPAPQAFGVVQIGLTEMPMQRELSKILRNFLFLTLGIITTGIVLTNFLARRIITPLRNLAAGARKVGEGDLSTFVVPTTQDEVGPIDHALQSHDQITPGTRSGDLRQRRNDQKTCHPIDDIESIQRRDHFHTRPGRLLSTILELLSENLGFARMILFLWDNERGHCDGGTGLWHGSRRSKRRPAELSSQSAMTEEFVAEMLTRGKPRPDGERGGGRRPLLSRCAAAASSIGNFFLRRGTPPQPTTDSRILGRRPQDPTL